MTLKEWLNKLFNPVPKPAPTIIEEIKYFDLSGIPYTVVNSQYLRLKLHQELIKQRVPEAGIGSMDKSPSDVEYLLYPEATLKEVFNLMPQFYNHTAFLDGKVERKFEGSDCDNHAEHNSYWFHYYLPACPVFVMNGVGPSAVGHAFAGILTKELTWKWYNVVMDKKEYTKIWNIRF